MTVVCHVSFNLLVLLLTLGSSDAHPNPADAQAGESSVPETPAAHGDNAPNEDEGITVRNVFLDGAFHVYGVRDRLGTAMTVILFLSVVSFFAAVVTAQVFRWGGMLVTILVVMTTEPSEYSVRRLNFALESALFLLSCVGGVLCYILCWGLPIEWPVLILYLVYFLAIMRTTTSVVMSTLSRRHDFDG